MDRDRPVYSAIERILRPLFTVVYRISITGREHVPETGPCILAANHVSVMDGFFLGIAVTRQVRFMAKAELHRVPIVKQILEAAGAFPVERGADAGRAIAAGVALLECGACIGVFPEGTSLPDQKRGYKRGAARLALATGAPLIPVALVGTELTLEPRTHRIRLPRVHIVIGEPLVVARQEPTEAAATELTRRLQAAIEGLVASTRQPSP
ncbi:MAG TPA: lysophospholipid acyltransferase family protein [Gaiellaceae bacterium]|nr:lysophospholipid acyltransferase family protein [Gaiellaceae bacterium]